MSKYIIILLFLLAACTNPRDITGTWQTKHYSLWDKGLLMVHGWYVGANTKLILHPDSSWQMEGSCEVFAGSQWRIKKDSLFLFPDTCWGTQNASLNTSKAGFKGRFLTYKIRHRSLEKRNEGFVQHHDSDDSLVKHKFIFFEKLEPTK